MMNVKSGMDAQDLMNLVNNINGTRFKGIQIRKINGEAIVSIDYNKAYTVITHPMGAFSENLLKNHLGINLSELKEMMKITKYDKCRNMNNAKKIKIMLESCVTMKKLAGDETNV